VFTKTPLVKGVQQPEKSFKTPGNVFFDALLMSRFEKFADAPQKTEKTALRAHFGNHTSSGFD